MSNTPKIIRTEMAPVYTAIWIIAMNGASNSRYKPATMLDMIPKKNAAYTMSWYSKAKMARAIARIDRAANSSNSISIGIASNGILDNSC